MRLASIHSIELPEGVLLSAQEVSRAKPLPDPVVPRWLKPLLPKSGLAGQVSLRGFNDEEDNPDDEDEFFDGDREPSVLHPVSFEVRGGQGLGLVGPDGKATLSLVRILVRIVPPSTGRVAVRGLVAPLVKHDLTSYTGEKWGWKAVLLAARFLHWPRPVLRARYDEILEFASLHELEGRHEVRPFRNKTTMRLLYAAALHMGASVYVVDEGIPSDDEYGHRCFDLLAQRQREGAAVIQRAERVEDVARLCHSALWLEDGEVRFSGPLVEVAVEAEKAHKETLHPLSAPVLASLPDSDGRVVISAEGSTVEIELQVLRKNVELGLSLQLVDEHGHARQLEAPDTFRCEALGHYRLRLSIPGGLLPDGVYEATLVAGFGVRGSDPTPPRPLFGFELVSEGQEELEADAADVSFELLTETEEPTEASTEEDVEWNVSRASA